MVGEPQDGHDGPYAAPIAIGPATVQPGWIDYNGHMNVAYYTLAVDNALDEFLENTLGLGESFVARQRMGPYSLQSSVQYLGELREGDEFSFEILLLDYDQKRMHLCITMLDVAQGSIAAIVETLAINVDLNTRRSTPYHDWTLARLAALRAAHEAAPRPETLGRPLGIRRAG